MTLHIYRNIPINIQPRWGMSYCLQPWRGTTTAWCI